MKSWKREPTEDDLMPFCNVFDQLGRNRDEDMHTHLAARRNSATSRERDDLPAFSSINDEIKELRDILKKLGPKKLRLLHQQ